MKYRIYKEEDSCPKCGFPYKQVNRWFCQEGHKFIDNNQVLNCSVAGEHLHIECVCGYEAIVRPKDWNEERKDNAKRNSSVKKRDASRSRKASQNSK